jgi:DNA-binding transcriptional MerR regulator
MVDLVRRAGFSLDEARELLDDRTPGRPPGDRWQALVARKQVELDELLAAVRAAARLLVHLADCRRRSLEECLAAVDGQ